MIDEFSIPVSHDSHDLPVDLIYANDTSDKNNDTVIIAHGNGNNRKCVYPYAEIFLENGYNVLCFDQRSQGKNKAKHTTFGYLDKYDLKDCAAYIKKESPD